MATTFGVPFTERLKSVGGTGIPAKTAGSGTGIFSGGIVNIGTLEAIVVFGIAPVPKKGASIGGVT